MNSFGTRSGWTTLHSTTPPRSKSSTLEDFLIYRLDSCGKAMTFDKRSVIAFFEARRNDGEPHQNESIAFLHASQSGDVGMVVGKRTMRTGGEPQELLFTQVWRRQDGGWRMIREAVSAQAAS